MVCACHHVQFPNTDLSDCRGSGISLLALPQRLLRLLSQGNFSVRSEEANLSTIRLCYKRGTGLDPPVGPILVPQAEFLQIVANGLCEIGPHIRDGLCMVVGMQPCFPRLKIIRK